MTAPLGERAFNDWLEKQRDRNDPVGDFANDAWQDENFPPSVGSERDLVAYMEQRGAEEDAVEAAREAWIEFGEHATEFVHPDEAVDWNVDDRE